MQVLSHGDRIAEGQYRLHSRFRRAANFLGDAGLVTVVDPSIGAGPINIAIDRLDSDLCFPTLTVKTDCFVLGQTALKKNPGCLYRSVIRLQPRDSRTFLENLAVLGDCLRGDAPSGSMAFLLGRNAYHPLMSASFSQGCGTGCVC